MNKQIYFLVISMIIICWLVSFFINFLCVPTVFHKWNKSVIPDITATEPKNLEARPDKADKQG